MAKKKANKKKQKKTVPKVVKFDVPYRKSVDYKVVPVSGVYGGVNSQGKISCEFYLEKLDIPESATLEVHRDSGTLLGERHAGGTIVDRTVGEVQVGMALEPAQARSMGEWLITKADEFDKATGGKQNGKDDEKKK